MKTIARNKTDYLISKTNAYVEFFVYWTTAFVIPFLIGYPQLLVWSIVNAMLVLAALNLKNIKLLPIIMLPSIAVLMRWVIFGPYTIFLLYLIPFIWIGNWLLVMAMKLRFNKLLNLLIWITAKTFFIIVAIIILYKLNIVPEVLIKPMWMMQLYTVILWWSSALIIQYFKKQYFDKKI